MTVGVSAVTFRPMKTKVTIWADVATVVVARGDDDLAYLSPAQARAHADRQPALADLLKKAAAKVDSNLRDQGRLPK